jgi:hypothetical protein
MNSRKIQHWTTDLDARLDAHRHGRGARLMEVITKAGITWQLARTWPGGRDRERAIKNRHEGPQLCPICTPRPFPVTTGRAATITPVPGPAILILPQPVPVSPRERGLRMAALFLAQRTGWTAERLAASLDYITSPCRQAPPRTPARDETMRVFTQTVTGQIAILAAADSGHLPREHQ